MNDRMIKCLYAFTVEYGLGAKTHVNDAVINGHKD